METRLPIEYVRVGDELFHPSEETWSLVEAIAAPDALGRVLVTFSSGPQVIFPAGDFVTVSHAPYICTKCKQEGAGFQDQDLCECGAISWAPAGWVCPSCRRVRPLRGECLCGVREPWVWWMLPRHAPAPSRPALRPAPPPQLRPAPARPALASAALASAQGEPTLDERILAAVRAGDLPSANAVVKEIGGRRQDVYAAIKAMLGDDRLRVVNGYLRAGRTGR
jgi:hypothetical protein